MVMQCAQTIAKSFYGRRWLMNYSPLFVQFSVTWFQLSLFPPLPVSGMLYTVCAWTTTIVNDAQLPFPDVMHTHIQGLTGYYREPVSSSCFSSRTSCKGPLVQTLSPSKLKQDGPNGRSIKDALSCLSLYSIYLYTKYVSTICWYSSTIVCISYSILLVVYVGEQAHLWE